MEGILASTGLSWAPEAAAPVVKLLGLGEHAPMADLVPAPPPDPAAEPPNDPDHALVAPEVAAAAAASVRSMLRALTADRLGTVTRDGPSIEDVVRAAVRPVLKE